MKTFDSVVIGHTSKGRRVWLQTLEDAGFPAGTGFTVSFEGPQIVIAKDNDAKRKVVASKRGVIDLVSKRVTAWAQNSERATVFFTPTQIIIEREVN